MMNAAGQPVYVVQERITNAAKAYGASNRLTKRPEPPQAREEGRHE